jgi:glyoxylase-like metal-dependent hydrolase (beta-lactamase superfamily II)
VIRFSAGDVRLTVLDAGSLRLDGGAMFGVVPKPLWSRLREADDRNRILLKMNVLLIEDGDQRILVDTGAGTRWGDKERDIYDLEVKDADAILAPAGLTADRIDLVINSHLHFDHAGGNTVGRDGDAGLEAAYPNARYVVQRGEVETARWRNERIRASYRADDFEPLAREDRLWLVEGEASLGPNILLRPAPGHTPHMQVPMVVTSERTVAFLADLVPTTSHLAYPYIMGYDLEPLTTLATKKRFLPEAVREGWYVVFEHDPEILLGVLGEVDGRLEARPVEAETATRGS